jgi:hypothetical protein
MHKTTKSLLKGSHLEYYNGIQNKFILTSNINCKKAFNGIDSTLNVVMLKLVKKYDESHFYNCLKVGIEFKYQTYTYAIQSNESVSMFHLIVWHSKNENIVYNHRISKTSFKKIEELNNDINDLLKALFDNSIL